MRRFRLQIASQAATVARSVAAIVQRFSQARKLATTPQAAKDKRCLWLVGRITHNKRCCCNNAQQLRTQHNSVRGRVLRMVAVILGHKQTIKSRSSAQE